jgi:hypothetical protein
MLKKLILTGFLAASIAGPALASNCPNLMAEIDAALETAQLSDEDMARVTELRATGEAEHAAGNHTESEAALTEAKGLLGLE